MAEQNDVMGDDALVSLWSDVRVQRQRLSKLADPTPKKVLSELSDTGLSVIEDMLGYFVQFRQYVSESLQDVDGRLNELEQGSVDQGIDIEAAEMILRLAGTCEAFVRLIKESSASISSEAQGKLDEALSLVEQVRSWVAENVDADGLEAAEDGSDDEADSEGDSEDDQESAEG